MANYKNNQKYSDGITNTFWEDFVIPNVKRIKHNKCEKCGSTKDLHIHHTSYTEVTIHTLKLWCRGCHFRHHAKERKGV